MQTAMRDKSAIAILLFFISESRKMIAKYVAYNQSGSALLKKASAKAIKKPTQKNVGNQ